MVIAEKSADARRGIEMVAFLGMVTVGPGRFAIQGWWDRTVPSMRWLRWTLTRDRPMGIEFDLCG